MEEQETIARILSAIQNDDIKNIELGKGNLIPFIYASEEEVRMVIARTENNYKVGDDINANLNTLIENGELLVNLTFPVNTEGIESLAVLREWLDKVEFELVHQLR